MTLSRSLMLAAMVMIGAVAGNFGLLRLEVQLWAANRSVWALLHQSQALLNRAEPLLQQCGEEYRTDPVFRAKIDALQQQR